MPPDPPRGSWLHHSRTPSASNFWIRSDFMLDPPLDRSPVLLHCTCASLTLLVPFVFKPQRYGLIVSSFTHKKIVLWLFVQLKFDVSNPNSGNNGAGTIERQALFLMAVKRQILQSLDKERILSQKLFRQKRSHERLRFDIMLLISNILIKS